MLNPNTTHISVIIISIGHSSSAYSLPVVYPISRETAAQTIMNCQPQKWIFPSLLLCQSDFTLAWLALHKFYGQAERAISTGKLNALLRLHILPIKHVVFVCPSSPFWVGRSNLVECFPLICIQRLSQPNFATQLCHWHDNWNTRGSSIPVLSY